MSSPRNGNKRGRSVNGNSEENYSASDGEKRPCKRLQKPKTPLKLVQPEAKKKPTVNEQAGRSTSKAKITEKSLVRTANTTMTKPKLQRTSLPYINNEPVDHSVAVLQTASADDQNTASNSEQRGLSSLNDFRDQKKDSTNGHIQHNPCTTEHTTRIIQKRRGRFLSDTAYPGVLEPDVVLSFKTSSDIQKTLWLSEELQQHGYAKMDAIMSSKRKKVFAIPELQHIRKSIRRNKQIPLKLEHAQRYMLNWLKAWAVIYRQTGDLRSYSGSIWLRGTYSTVELDRGEEELHMILEDEHNTKSGSEDEDVATFKKITALQIEKMHTRLTEETALAGTKAANVTSPAKEKLALRHRPPSIMQSIESMDSSPPVQVPFRASRRASMAMSLSDVSSDDQAPGDHDQAIAPVDNKVRGAFRELFGVMQRSQTPSSPTPGGTAADTHGAWLLPPTFTSKINDVKGHGEESQATSRNKVSRSASFSDVIDLTSDVEDDGPSPHDNKFTNPSFKNSCVVVLRLQNRKG